MNKNEMKTRHLPTIAFPAVAIAVLESRAAILFNFSSDKIATMGKKFCSLRPPPRLLFKCNYYKAPVIGPLPFSAVVALEN